MGSLSIYHILVVALVLLMLFGGKGRISDTMGDFAKGLKSFRKGLAEDVDNSPAKSASDESPAR